MADLMDPSKLLELLTGNRRLTLRTVNAFTEKDLFHYSPIEPMRPFAGMVQEFLRIEDVIMQGIVTGDWKYDEEVDKYKGIATARELLEACESVRRQTLERWPQFTAERLLAVEKDQWGTMRNVDRLQYALENEIHHRGQAFVYLRLLGTEPPAFYER
jgi:uncharacterized damage-inducible protein DinB